MFTDAAWCSEMQLCGVQGCCVVLRDAAWCSGMLHGAQGCCVVLSIVVLTDVGWQMTEEVEVIRKGKELLKEIQSLC